MKNAIIIVLFALCLAGSCLSQSQSVADGNESYVFVPGPPSMPGAWMDHQKVAGFAFREIEETGPTIKGVPYTATAIREVTQVLPNGDRVVKKTAGSLARDHQGRTLKEIASQQPGGTKLLRIITDPAADATYMFTSSGKPSETPLGIRFSNTPAKSIIVGREGGQSRSPGEVKHEMLGRQLMQGIVVEGERATRLIPAGAVGNDHALEIITETWISPALQIVMLSHETDPRFGETVYRLIDLNQAEPDLSLFEIPSDYQKKFNELLQTMRPLQDSDSK